MTPAVIDSKINIGGSRRKEVIRDIEYISVYVKLTDVNNNEPAHTIEGNEKILKTSSITDDKLDVKFIMKKSQNILEDITVTIKRIIRGDT